MPKSHLSYNQVPVSKPLSPYLIVATDSLTIEGPDDGIWYEVSERRENDHSQQQNL